MVESLFLDAVRVLTGRLDAATRSAYATVEVAYKGRPYHNLKHVEQTLDAYLFLAEGFDANTAAEVVLALCLHDAVYDPHAEDNEAQSAALARRLLSPLGFDEADLARVERLILVTCDHQPRDETESLVVDADLSILQASPDEYDRYAAAIRKEYAFVPNVEYRMGRTRVLQSLMARRLFTSPLLDEEAARANMSREIESLQA